MCAALVEERQQIQRICRFMKQGARLISTRWVLTDKNSSLRQLHPTLGLLAKARLVVIGCQEDTSEIRGDSPTCSMLDVHIICSTTATRGWRLQKLDAKNAYLQAGGITRCLLLKMPRPLPPGVDPNTVVRASGSIYIRFDHFLIKKQLETEVQSLKLDLYQI